MNREERRKEGDLEPIKPKKIMLVIEDDGAQQFKFYLDGDIDRIKAQVPTHKYSAAEYWAVQFLGICTEYVEKNSDVKHLEGVNE